MIDSINIWSCGCGHDIYQDDITCSNCKNSNVQNLIAGKPLNEKQKKTVREMDALLEAVNIATKKINSPDAHAWWRQPVRPMTPEENRLMEKAFWNSVEIVHKGKKL